MRCYFRSLIASAFVLSFGFNSLAAKKANLVLNPSRPMERTELEVPFEYSEIGQGARFQYVTQGAAALKTKDSNFGFMVIGPLQPCVGIVFRDKATSNILAFHKHWTNSLESMVQIVKSSLGDPANISVGIFSMHHPNAEAEMALKFGGYSQIEEAKAIRKYIIENLGIPGKQVALSVYDKPATAPQNLGQYSFIYSGYLLIGKDGSYYVTDPFKEDIFGHQGIKVAALGGSGGPKMVPLAKLDLISQLKFFVRKDQEFQDARTRAGLRLGPNDRLPWTISATRTAASLKDKTPFFLLQASDVLVKGSTADDEKSRRAAKGAGAGDE